MSARAIDLEAYAKVAAKRPPARIESEVEYKRAMGIADELMTKESLTPEEARLLKTWAVLIEDFERHRHNDLFTTGEPRDILRFLMEENGLKQGDFTGIPQSKISAILSGSRAVSKGQARILACRFKVSPALFL